MSSILEDRLLKMHQAHTSFEDVVSWLIDEEESSERMEAALLEDACKIERLQDLLDCEAGERAPAGWGWSGGTWRLVGNRVCGCCHQASISHHDDGWHSRMEIATEDPPTWKNKRQGPFRYALEAIEAAEGESE